MGNKLTALSAPHRTLAYKSPLSRVVDDNESAPHAKALLNVAIRRAKTRGRGSEDATSFLILDSDGIRNDPANGFVSAKRDLARCHPFNKLPEMATTMILMQHRQLHAIHTQTHLSI